MTPREANRLVAKRINGHGHEGNTDLLSRGKEHIHFASRRLFRHFTREADKFVRLLAHGADHHDHLVTTLVGANRLASSSENFFRIRDAGSTEFLNDQSHDGFQREEYRGNNKWAAALRFQVLCDFF